MSLVDDARRLERSPWAPLPNSLGCFYCRLESLEEAHAPDCPVRSLPRIVAALEAADRVLRDPMGAPEHEEDGTCWFCGQGDPQKRDLQAAGHAPDCSWSALVAALKGEA